MSKKIIVCLVALLVIVPVFASADTISELQAQIASLMAQVKQLQAQLSQAQGQQSTKWCHTFNTDLKISDRGDEVTALRNALVLERFSVTSEGGDKGGNLFDEYIASAVSSFQQKYKSEILTPAGLYSPTGYVGGRTRTKLNAIYGCGNTIPVPAIPSPTTPVACTTEAKLCSNGSYVSRTGPNCEFATCPTISIQPYTPTIDYYNPSLVIPGETMTLIGSNYDQSAYVVIDGNYSSITPSSITTGAGRHSLTFIVPSTIAGGSHSVQVGVKASPLSNKTSFEIAFVTVKLKTDARYTTTNNDSAILTTSIAGSYLNKTVNYWKLRIACGSGVIAAGKGNPNLCGQELRADTYNMANPEQDYTFLTTEISNTSSTNSDLTLTLTGHSASGNTLGTDKYLITLGGKTAALGTIIPSTTFATFNVQRGSANPPYMAIHLTNSSSVPITFTQSVTNQPSWLNVSYNTEPMLLSAGGVMGTGVAIDATKVTGTGTFTTNLIISGNFTNSPITIPITLTVY